MSLDLKVTDALLGMTYTLETLDGVLEVKIPEGIAPNEVLRVKGKGVPTAKGKRGDILIKINVKIPNKLNRKSRELIEALKKEGI
jgi:DnaJ-class molecular chaperone